MTFRCIHVPLLCSILVVSACAGDSQQAAAPGMPSAPSPLPAPSPVPTPPRSNLANWRADATVLSATITGRSCGWGTTVGDIRRDVEWRITITGGSILLEEDMPNFPTDHIPFSGSLIGRQFTATYDTGPDYLKWACQFKGGTLTGTF